MDTGGANIDISDIDLAEGCGLSSSNKPFEQLALHDSARWLLTLMWILMCTCVYRFLIYAYLYL
jgi:hypothetical protein